MPAEMISHFIQILASAIRQIPPHTRPQRAFAAKSSFLFEPWKPTPVEIPSEIPSCFAEFPNSALVALKLP